MRRLLVVLVLVGCGGEAASVPPDPSLVREFEVGMQVAAAWENLTEAERDGVCSSTEAVLRRNLLEVLESAVDLETAVDLVGRFCAER